MHLRYLGDELQAGDDGLQKSASLLVQNVNFVDENESDVGEERHQKVLPLSRDRIELLGGGQNDVRSFDLLLHVKDIGSRQGQSAQTKLSEPLLPVQVLLVDQGVRGVEIHDLQGGAGLVASLLQNAKHCELHQNGLAAPGGRPDDHVPVSPVQLGKAFGLNPVEVLEAVAEDLLVLVGEIGDGVENILLRDVHGARGWESRAPLSVAPDRSIDRSM